MKKIVWLVILLVFVGGCGNQTVSKKTDLETTEVKTDENKKEEAKTDEKKAGEVSLSEDGETIYVRGEVEKSQVTNEKTGKAKKIIFSKDAHLVVEESDMPPEPDEYKSIFLDAPLLEKIEVEEGNPYLFTEDDMLMEYSEDGDGSYGIIGCVPRKKGSVSIPEGVEYIGLNAFCDCSMITSVQISSTVHAISNPAFPMMDSCKKFDVDKKNKEFYSIDGILYEKEFSMTKNNILIAYPCAKEDEIFNAPKKITGIARGAFTCNSHIEEVYLPSKTVYIEEDAFYRCPELTRVKVKDHKKINYVGGRNLECPSLKEFPKDKLEP